MAEVFVSYSSTDRPQALALVEDLRSHGFSVWVDRGGIHGGASNWSAEIVEAINDCSTLILLLSPHSVTSRNVAKEVQLASEKRKNILPVVLEKTALPTHLEYPLAGIQSVHYHDHAALLHAMNMLHGLAERVEESRSADRSVRVAVMPFDDLSPERDNQWFADGMMDELIATLGHIENVKIPSRSDVLHYREHRKKSRDVAMELGVRYLIEGGVRKAQNKVRVNASLVDTLKGEQLWSGKFDGTFDDVFEMQENVSKQVADALSIHLGPKELAEIESRPTQNAKAYELFLKGRQQQYYVTKDSYLRALDLYEHAAALDPKFVQAQIGIASICCVYYREYSKNPNWLKRADATLATVERISGESSKSLYVRGMIEWLRGNLDEAIGVLARSAERDPKNVNALNLLGAVYMSMQNFGAAAEALQEATNITESTMAYFNLIVALSEYDKERLQATAEKALPVFDRYLLREPSDINAQVTRGFILHYAGHRESAEHVAEKLLLRSDLKGRTLYQLGVLFDIVGKPRVYNELLRKAIASGYRDLDSTRGWTFDTNDPECESEFRAILTEFEQVVAREATLAVEAV